MTKNVLITGGNSGIGLEMARALAGEGHRVIIASRDQKKSESAIADVRKAQPGASIEAMHLDLGDFADVDRFARELLVKMPVIDILMLNSGLYAHKLRVLPNGLESMIGIMHFGHFRLVQRLLDAVKAADQGRIVVTSSMMHRASGIDEASFTDPSRHLLPVRGYAQAKLANLLFTRELARRLQGSKVTVNAFHPGGVATGIWQELPGPIAAVINLFLITPAKDTAVWLATSPEAARTSGEYFVRRKLAGSSAASRDPMLASKLWEISEQKMAG